MPYGNCANMKDWGFETFMMEYRALGRTGLTISNLGFGAAPFGNAYGETHPEELNRAVSYAIDHGINFFDVAPYYGLTLAESRLGLALEGRRDQVVLMTKCGRYGLNDFDFSAGRLHKSIDESLTRLKTDHVDILLAHDIEFADMKQIAEETIPALEAIKAQGKTRFIGVSGLPLGVLIRAVETGKLDVVLSYCHYNLLSRDLDQHLTPVAQKHGLGLINASPLHMGTLTEKGAPDWHPAPQEVKKAGRAMFEYCESRGLSLPQVALRMALDYSPVATTLVGISNVSEVERNIKTMATTSDPELLDRLREIAGPAFNQTWDSGRPENSDRLLPASQA